MRRWGLSDCFGGLGGIFGVGRGIGWDIPLHFRGFDGNHLGQGYNEGAYKLKKHMTGPKTFTI
jgi:hypothetical protein